MGVSKERNVKTKSESLLLDCQSPKVSKQVEKPRLHTNSNVQFVQKLKQKDLEILNLKQKLWLRDSRQMMAPRSKSTIVDVLGAYGLKGRESVNLKSKVDKRDEELKVLKQEYVKMNKRLESKERELDAMKNDLDNKDHEMLGALMEKNKEIFVLKQEKCQLENDAKNQTMQKLCDAIITTESEDDSEELKTLTAEFLEKVSNICRDKNTRVKASSKDKSIKIQVKVTVKREKGINMTNLSSMSDTFNDSPFRLTKAFQDVTEEEYRYSSDEH